MNSLKSMIWKPTPEEQRRKCNSLIRSNTRKLDRDIVQLKALEGKTKNLIIQANKRGQRDSSRQRQAAQETRTFARELVRVRRQNARLQTSKAQLDSVQMQVNEAFSVRKIEGSMKASTGMMKDVNQLIRLPELTGSMRQLGEELIRAGVLEEMVDETLSTGELDEMDDEAEEEVDKVLQQILEPREPAPKVSQTQEPVSAPPVPAALIGETEEDEEDQEAVLSQMRGRLEALKS